MTPNQCLKSPATSSWDLSQVQQQGNQPQVCRQPASMQYRNAQATNPPHKNLTPTMTPCATDAPSSARSGNSLRAGAESSTGSGRVPPPAPSLIPLPAAPLPPAAALPLPPVRALFLAIPMPTPSPFPPSSSTSPSAPPSSPGAGAFFTPPRTRLAAGSPAAPAPPRLLAPWGRLPGSASPCLLGAAGAGTGRPLAGWRLAAAPALVTAAAPGAPPGPPAGCYSTHKCNRLACLSARMVQRSLRRLWLFQSRCAVIAAVRSSFKLDRLK